VVFLFFSYTLTLRSAASFTGALISYAIVCQCVFFHLFPIFPALIWHYQKISWSVLLPVLFRCLIPETALQTPQPNAAYLRRAMLDEVGVFLISAEQHSNPSTECPILSARVLLVDIQAYYSCVLPCDTGISLTHPIT
jgi:hypothetical protein